MERERLDLTPLDPTGDPAFMERMVARIMGAAQVELYRRAGGGDIYVLLGRWSRPALAAAALLAVLAGSVLARSEFMTAPVQAAVTSPYVTADLASEADVLLWQKLVLPPMEIELLATLEGEFE
ncbi:MAG: hypothetical protein WEB88_17050 [Gemmatimonadota bacterium]